MPSICLHYIGFGDYLHSIDPSREWDEHLQYMLVFCLVHVKRNFAKRFPTHKARYIIEQIWEAETEQKLTARMQSICTLHPELTSWINNKKKTWILAGLAKEKSKVPHKWWAYARKHTGIGESSHFQDNNFTGRKLCVLTAVLR
jgi:hypothetical protein